MSTNESHPALQISFSGEPGQACQTFIDHVMEYAFENNKQGDDRWMADFAGMRLRGEALMWLTQLDEETQESWRKLRKELVWAYWPTSDTVVKCHCSPDSSSTLPTPAAAPPVPATTGIPFHGLDTPSGLRRGIIRIVSEEPGCNGYVSKVLSKGGSLTRTAGVANAATAEFSLSDHPHEIKLMGIDDSPMGLMGLHWGSEPQTTPDTLSSGRLTTLQLRDGKYISGIKDHRGPTNPFVWLALMDGSLIAIHRNTSSIQHVEVCVILKDTLSLCIGLVFENIRDYYAKADDSPLISRARLVFEAA